ncbi:MAG: hypothetical protein ACD_78C00061G0002 [uncultured bacterium (gcode 4)]|uniref:Uncharacterized protein n=1 Tax=uncultured bacterium (gcode 4) TaxID=1234023 RepID=K1XZP3_9BACT|nr:MAG: hypothetical protein ACD_78C00061G0002 [uncultured bacterium (gcode 4)]
MNKIFIIVFIVFFLVFWGMYYFLHIWESPLWDETNYKKGDTATMSWSEKNIEFPIF